MALLLALRSGADARQDPRSPEPAENAVKLQRVPDVQSVLAEPERLEWRVRVMSRHVMGAVLPTGFDASTKKEADEIAAQLSDFATYFEVRTPATEWKKWEEQA